jgi:hypothetical protein
MRAVKLLGSLTIYYAVIALLVFVTTRIWPDFQGYLPVGGVESLINQPSQNLLETKNSIQAENRRKRAAGAGEAEGLISRCTSRAACPSRCR